MRGEPSISISPAALDGIRVIEMGQLIAGPFAGKTFGEFGADVIKVAAFIGASMLVGIAAITLGPSTRGLALEDISH